jgi:hypothetical protein
MTLIKEARRWQKLAGILKEDTTLPSEKAVPDSEIPEEAIPEEEAPTPDIPAGPISKADAKQMIKDTKGKFFTVTFTKKDGTTRVMNARLGVKAYLKGGELPYDPDAKGLIPVYDVKTRDYRMVNVNTITKLKIGNNEYQVR